VQQRNIQMIADLGDDRRLIVIDALAVLRMPLGIHDSQLAAGTIRGQIDDLIGLSLRDDAGKGQGITGVCAAGLQSDVIHTPRLKLLQQLFTDRTLGPEN
jgi:hypothetical protein